MRKAYLLYSLLLILLIMVDIQAKTKAISKQADRAKMESEDAWLVTVQGQVKLKRRGWKTYYPATVGMALRRGDLLQVAKLSKATIVCADKDRTRRDLLIGIHGISCKAKVARFFNPNDTLAPPRAVPATFIPLIVSPRKTRLLSTHPVLRWMPVQGISNYKIGIDGPNVSWNREVGSRTELVYPDNAPPLAPGLTYKLTVIAGERSSIEEDVPGLGFTLINLKEAQKVRAEVMQIKSIKLPESASRYLISKLYVSHGLYAEAIEELEQIVTTTPESAVMRVLADLYLRIGLTRLAEDRYLRALEMTNAADMEGQAITNEALGQIYKLIGNRSEAVARLQKASSIYGKLGDTRKVFQIQKQLSRLLNG